MAMVTTDMQDIQLHHSVWILVSVRVISTGKACTRGASTVTHTSIVLQSPL